MIFNQDNRNECKRNTTSCADKLKYCRRLGEEKKTAKLTPAVIPSQLRAHLQGRKESYENNRDSFGSPRRVEGVG